MEQTIEKTYWNANGKFQKESEKLLDELVPYSGKCDTIEGENLRALFSIYYDYYNNGMCNDTSGAVNWLISQTSYIRQVTNVSIYKELNQIKKHSNTFTYCKDDLEEELEKIADNVIQYVISKNGNYSPNYKDMHDYKEESKNHRYQDY
jgi:hypothetical protein